MKRQLKTLKGKRVVLTNNANEITRNEIGIIEKQDGTLEVKEHDANGNIENIAGGSGGNEGTAYYLVPREWAEVIMALSNNLSGYTSGSGGYTIFINIPMYTLLTLMPLSGYSGTYIACKIEPFNLIYNPSSLGLSVTLKSTDIDSIHETLKYLQNAGANLSDSQIEQLISSMIPITKEQFMNEEWLINNLV